MRKIAVPLLVFLVIALALGYLLYPAVSDQLAQSRDAETMRAYRAKAAAMAPEKAAEQFESASAYNGTLGTIRTEDVFTAGTPRTSRDYQSRLNVHSGVIGQLQIPAIGAALPVYHNCAETPVTNHLVHLNGSSLPSDEPGTSIVLAGPGLLRAEGLLGQIGLTDGRMLEDLDRLTPGSLLILNVMDRTMVYRVEEVQMMSPAGVQELDLTPAEDQELLTVITRKNDRRLVVRSSRITVAEARDLLEADDRAVYPQTWVSVLLLGLPVLLFGLLVMWVIERIKRHSYLLPGEGKQAAKREQKARKKLETITPETIENEAAANETNTTETDEGEKK